MPLLMEPLLLLLALLLALVPATGAGSAAVSEWGPGSADPDMFSPILPSPAAASNGSATLTVSPALSFTIKAGNSSVLRAAFTRYRALMFAWGPERPADTPSPGETLSVVHVSVANGDDSAMQLHADESYTLKIPDSGGAASLAANTTWGALRGLETLSQLVEWREEPGRYELRMAPWEIEDSPRFPYRGALIVSQLYRIRNCCTQQQAERRSSFVCFRNALVA
eukprot:COSAG06_NODE_1487_length_9296_cov_19.025226_10_plen_224_part_00